MMEAELYSPSGGCSGDQNADTNVNSKSCTHRVPEGMRLLGISLEAIYVTF